MSKSKRLAMRVIRKSAHTGNKALLKTLSLTTRIEGKAGRILDGTDFSMRIDNVVPIEKVYYNSLSYITPLNPALPFVGQKVAVVLLLPTLDGKSFYGGTATALYAAGRLAELQRRPLRIVQTIKTGHAENLSGFFRAAGINLDEESIHVSSVADRAYNIYGYLPMHPDDIFIASAWWDAYLISQLPLTKKFIYLIQDFEPIFYNNSDLYVLAESTYKLEGYIPLCNTKLMYDFMKERQYPAFQKATAGWFEPAVSRIETGTVLSKGNGEKKRLFLYGRPDVQRNLFFTALDAIDYSFKAGFLKADEWELFMAGQDKLPNIKLSSGVIITNKGKMGMDEYIEFSKSIDLAVSPMMAPHPNYPTLEFASIGSAVVTTKYANKEDLTKYSPNIVMSDIGVESLAGAIKLAASQPVEDRLANLRRTNIPKDWATTIDDALKKAVKSL